MPQRLNSVIRCGAFLFSTAYICLLLAWFSAYLVLGDSPGYLGLVNMVAVYLFLPLLIFPFFIVFLSSRLIVVGSVAVFLIFAYLWGYLFVPIVGRQNNILGHEIPKLRIMTCNVLAYHKSTQPVIKNIQSVDADIIFLQEVNHQLADAINSQLSKHYPFQVLEPADHPAGMGVISRFPITKNNEKLPDHWIGSPQILSLKCR